MITFLFLSQYPLEQILLSEHCTLHSVECSLVHRQLCKSHELPGAESVVLEYVAVNSRGRTRSPVRRLELSRNCGGGPMQRTNREGDSRFPRQGFFHPPSVPTQLVLFQGIDPNPQNHSCVYPGCIRMSSFNCWKWFGKIPHLCHFPQRTLRSLEEHEKTRSSLRGARHWILANHTVILSR